MDLKNIIVAVLLWGLFIFAILSLSINLTTENNAGNLLANNTIVNSTFEDLQGELSGAQEEVNRTKEAFESESGSIIQTAEVSSSIIGAGITYMGLLFDLVFLPFKLISTALGVSPIVFGVISAIIILTAVLAIWKVIKSGK